MLSNLELTNYQDILAEERRNNLFYRLKHINGLERVFITGSHKKRTLVRPLQGKFDIDCFAVLPFSLYQIYNQKLNGQSQLLQYIRSHLNNYAEYNRTNIKGNGQAVTIELANFDIDVVPAFSLSIGGYYIPDSRNGGSWVITYPEKQDKELNDLNSKYDYKFKKFIKLVKAWKQAMNVPLSGFMAEVLVTNFVSSTYVFPFGNFPSYQEAIAAFFAKLNTSYISSYYGSEDVLAGLSSTSRTDYRSKVSTAAYNSGQAISEGNIGNSINAIQYWSRVFGGYCK